MRFEALILTWLVIGLLLLVVEGGMCVYFIWRILLMFDDDLTALETTASGIAADTSAAVKEIADLKATIAAGGGNPTPAQQARLTALETSLGQVDAALKAGL